MRTMTSSMVIERKSRSKGDVYVSASYVILNDATINILSVI